MEFNSQICTTIEQSERLLALGLKKYTADMHYYHTVDFEGNEVWYPLIIPYENVVVASDFVGETEICLENYTIPAWSLHRLMEIGNFVNVGFLNIDKMYECCIQMIEGQIRGGILNKKYLNEK